MPTKKAQPVRTALRPKPKRNVKVKVSVGRCEMYVDGMDANCPLCGALVTSGERHQCERHEFNGGTKKGVANG